MQEFLLLQYIPKAFYVKRFSEIVSSPPAGVRRLSEKVLPAARSGKHPGIYSGPGSCYDLIRKLTDCFPLRPAGERLEPKGICMLPKLIVIEGTNASGKSSLGVTLAERFGGEIVSADSRQVFERLDLGSGKITPKEMRGVPHHLLNVVKPGEFFSMADFQRRSYEAIDGILSRGNVPFLVGGTGLYVDAVADGYELSDRAPDPALRAHFETFETPALYEMLKEQLPDTDIDPRNRHRVMRALERLAADDYAPAAKSSRFTLLKLGVTWPREILKQRIDERLEMRLAQGMVDEVKALLDEGISDEFLVKLGLEYKYLTWYLTGRIGYDRMVEELGNAIKKFAKRQMTWFRRDPRIHWLDMSGDPVAEASGLIEAFLR